MGNSIKSWWTASNNEPRGEFNHLTTFSSELQKFESERKIERSKTEMKDIMRGMSKYSINIPDQNIHDFYGFGNPIGQGKYGKVYLGYKKANPTIEVAIKVIKIRKIKSNFESVMKEIQMLQSVTHPDIVKILEIYGDSKKLYLVMEHVKGEELFDYIIKREKLYEEEARAIIWQLVEIVKYLNSIKICHRDLKPENIIVDPETLKIKLLDFGLSSEFDDLKELLSPVGTPYYVAPEVLNRKYNKEWDMWSVGIITYILLSGAPPFRGESLWDIYNEIFRFNLVFTDPEWKDITKEGIDFIKGLIEPNIAKRMVPDQALKHPWLNDNKTNISDSMKSKNPAHISKIKFEDYKKKTFLILKNIMDRKNCLKELGKCIDENYENTSFHSTDTRCSSPNWDWCKTLNKVNHLLELYADANIPFNEFLAQVFNDSKNITEEDISLAILELSENIGDKENLGSLINTSSANSNEYISFELRHLLTDEKEKSSSKKGDNTILEQDSSIRKLVMPFGQIENLSSASKVSTSNRRPFDVNNTTKYSINSGFKSYKRQATLNQIDFKFQISGNLEKNGRDLGDSRVWISNLTHYDSQTRF